METIIIKWIYFIVGFFSALYLVGIYQILKLVILDYIDNKIKENTKK
jgi:hypothetical protein